MPDAETQEESKGWKEDRGQGPSPQCSQSRAAPARRSRPETEGGAEMPGSTKADRYSSGNSRQSYHGEAGEWRTPHWGGLNGVLGNPMDEAGLTGTVEKVTGEPEGRPKPQM